MAAMKQGWGDQATVRRGALRVTGTIVLLSFFLLVLRASTASAEPLSMTFTEARANVGVQLSDAALFEAPDTSPLDAQIDPATGSITAGYLEVPEFSTHITDPINADVTVDFDYDLITGSFSQATGGLDLSGETNATLKSSDHECTISTTPAVLTLTSAGNSGGTSPRSGAPFTHGLTGAGAIAGQWIDMQATPVNPNPGGDSTFCANVEEQIEGPGGVYLRAQGDVTAPPPPQLTGTSPPSPSTNTTPRVLGSAEAGSTVRIFRNGACSGLPLATGSAAELAAPGITVTLDSFSIDPFSATATDVAGNTSPCSTTIEYTHEKILTERCTVPKLIGMTLGGAKAALKAGGCKLGNVRRPKSRRGPGHRALVVRSSNPRAGTHVDFGTKVDLRLGSKPRRAHSQ